MLVILFLAFSCRKDGSASFGLVGSWHLTSVSSKGSIGDVYVSFDRDGTFSLYQNTAGIGFVKCSGNYIFDDGVLNVEYVDSPGSAFLSSSYSISFGEGGSVLDVASLGDSPELLSYREENIPIGVIVSVIPWENV